MLSTELLTGPCRPAHVPPARTGRPAGSRRAAAILAGAALLLGAACAHRVPRPLSALCDGHMVTREVTLVVDSVAPPGGPALEAIRGREATILLTFDARLAVGPCEEQAGEATWSGELPAPLRQATDPDRRLTWRVQEDLVAVEFNPLTMDNNLSLVLPLRGGAGRWSLSGLAGELASGRARPLEPGR